MNFLTEFKMHFNMLTEARRLELKCLNFFSGKLFRNEDDWHIFSCIYFSELTWR